MPPISLLSSQAVAQIQSSKHITTLQSAALGLLENSLDAGSSKVEIVVDFGRGGCTVEDNGSGIPSDEFLEHGGLGKMYHTSKRGLDADLDIHGAHGSYLASLAALSLLSITSRHHGECNHATLTVHQGKVLARCVPAHSCDLSLSASGGTSVTVRDLFGSMPVRVKQRALNAHAGNDDRTWHELKSGVVALLLSWPRPCSVHIKDCNRQQRELRLSSLHSSNWRALTSKSLRSLEEGYRKYDVGDALPVVFQAGLAPFESRTKWVPVSASTPKLSIKGTICLEPAPTKQCQFVSIGVKPCVASHGRNEIYDIVNKAFVNSSFGCVDEGPELDQKEKDRRQHDRRYKRDSYTGKQLRGHKGVDRWPMFVLQVTFRQTQNVRTDPEAINSAGHKAVVDALEATATKWLDVNFFCPRKRARHRAQEQHSPAHHITVPQNLPLQNLPRANDRVSVAMPQKRPATTHGATTFAKKSRFETSGAGQVGDYDVVLGLCRSADFHGRSRIRSGRTGVLDDIWQLSKPATAPAGQLGTKIEPVQTPFRSMFKPAALEVGELDTVHSTAQRDKSLDLASAIGCVDAARFAVEDRSSSEDFGSFDDKAVVAALHDIDQTEKHSSQPLEGDIRAVSASVIENVTKDDAVLDWADPISRQCYKVNARTGVVMSTRPEPSGTVETANRSDVGSSVRSVYAHGGRSCVTDDLRLSRRDTSATERSANGWLSKILKNWSNPIFNRLEQESIPAASLVGRGIDQVDAAAKRCRHSTSSAADIDPISTGTGKLSKAGLKEAAVIKQVDKKFILCSFPLSGACDSGTTLVLIDQHAASERVILESLLTGLFAQDDLNTIPSTSDIQTKPLVKPLHFQIDSTEHQLFLNHQTHFKIWGVVYELSIKDEVLSDSQVRQPKREHILVVKSLPPVIAERCCSNPTLLIDLLRSEVWTVSDSGKGRKAAYNGRAQAAASAEDEPLWLRRIGSCPKGILNMLNSRACRSAIMFNDELKVAECEDLVVRLSNCAFPFMCAHGRVSMVPLIELESGDGFGFGLDEGRDRFAGFCAFERRSCG